MENLTICAVVGQGRMIGHGMCILLVNNTPMDAHFT